MVRLAFQRPKLSIYNYVYLLLSPSVLAPFAKCTIFFVTFFFVLSSLLPRLFRVLYTPLIVGFLFKCKYVGKSGDGSKQDK
jgi:hypothetical protein